MIHEHVQPNLGTQEIRLSHSTLPLQTTSTKHWIYQYRNSPAQEWNAYHAFPEYEFYPNDFNVMNFFTSQFTGGWNWQTRTVLIVKFLREGERIVGKLMLVDGEVKRNMGGRTELVTVWETEEERVRGLEEVFGITLTEEEREGIRGRNVELLG
jgi:arylamine N-acetyltransferase